MGSLGAAIQLERVKLTVADTVLHRDVEVPPVLLHGDLSPHICYAIRTSVTSLANGAQTRHRTNPPSPPMAPVRRPTCHLPFRSSHFPRCLLKALVGYPHSCTFNHAADWPRSDWDVSISKYRAAKRGSHFSPCLAKKELRNDPGIDQSSPMRSANEKARDRRLYPSHARSICSLASADRTGPSSTQSSWTRQNEMTLAANVVQSSMPRCTILATFHLGGDADDESSWLPFFDKSSLASVMHTVSTKIALRRV